MGQSKRTYGLTACNVWSHTTSAAQLPASSTSSQALGRSHDATSTIATREWSARVIWTSCDRLWLLKPRKISADSLMHEKAAVSLVFTVFSMDVQSEIKWLYERSASAHATPFTSQKVAPVQTDDLEMVHSYSPSNQIGSTIFIACIVLVVEPFGLSFLGGFYSYPFIARETPRSKRKYTPSFGMRTDFLRHACTCFCTCLVEALELTLGLPWQRNALGYVSTILKHKSWGLPGFSENHTGYWACLQSDSISPANCIKRCLTVFFRFSDLWYAWYHGFIFLQFAVLRMARFPSLEALGGLGLDTASWSRHNAETRRNKKTQKALRFKVRHSSPVLASPPRSHIAVSP